MAALFRDERKTKIAERVIHNLSYHRPQSDRTQDAMETIREASRVYADEILRLVPYSRELSLAVGHIEDACMNAIAGLARNEKDFLEG